MIEAIGLASALVFGVGWLKVTLVAGALYLPVPTLAMIAAAQWRRGVKQRSAVSFCDGVANELRAGSSLRQALAASARSAGLDDLVGLTESLTPMPEIAREAGVQLPEVGRELTLTITEVALSGSGGADVFDEIGTLALARAEVDREVKVASAPARATAALFVLGPAVYVLVQVRSGGLALLLSDPAQRTAALAGLGLFASGVAVAAAIFWRSR